MPMAALGPLETCPTGTENVRSSGVDQKSLVYGQTDAIDPHQTLARKARKLGSFNLHDIDADQCTNERLLKNYIKLLRE